MLVWVATGFNVVQCKTKVSYNSKFLSELSKYKRKEMVIEVETSKEYYL